MPTIIRHALFNKVIALQEYRQLVEDFELITGLPLDFLPAESDAEHRPQSPAPLCRLTQQCPGGREMCDATTRRLLSDAAERPACVTCDAGLQEAAVVLRISGIDVGFFRFAGVLPQEGTRADVHRMEHLLARVGVKAQRGELADARAQSSTLPKAVIGAYLRWLEAAAQALAQHVTAVTHPAPAMLPQVVQEAVRLIRKRALTENLDLVQVAKQCKVTPSHLSRTFHHATGLTFREYIARFRAEHAHDLLCNSRRSITEIALASGFQSFSQFNRVMRAVYGAPPRTLRTRHAAAQGT